MQRRLLFVLLLFITQSVLGQKFEGKITFEISYENLPPQAEQYKAMLPSESVVYIKGHKSRSEQETGMGGKQVFITDSKKKTGVLIMDVMGRQIMNRKDLKKAEKSQPEPEITYLDEEKKIAGYNCKKAEVKYEGAEESFIFYYTEEIPNINNSTTAKGLKGLPLQYEISKNGLILVFTAKEVNKEKIPDSLFEIPEGYTELSDEEMKEMFGGQ